MGAVGAAPAGVATRRTSEPTSFGTDLARNLAPGAGVGGAAFAWMKVFCTTRHPPSRLFVGVPHGGRLTLGVASTPKMLPPSSNSGQRSPRLQRGVCWPSSGDGRRLESCSTATFAGIAPAPSAPPSLLGRSGEEGAGLAGGSSAPLAAEALSAVDSAAESQGLASATASSSAAAALEPMSRGTDCERRSAPGSGVGGHAAWMKVFCTCQRTPGERATAAPRAATGCGGWGESCAAMSWFQSMLGCKIWQHGPCGHLRTAFGIDGDDNGVAPDSP
mmetsp:Transcript_100760/g.280709  ORF Transcript_100760/g.280709 Transcript_100760/m.280709 type:complete len:275 (+) Transcript_100760:628-1452(+)